MSQYNDGPSKAFTAGEALAAYRRVKVTDYATGTVGYADADEAHIGITEAPAAAGDSVSVRLANAQGTFKATASAAIAAGTPVFGTADGKVDDNSAGNPGVAVGIALEAATADGDVIEIAPIPSSAGTRWVAGQHTTVAASDTIITGLTKVICVVAQLDSDPGDDPYAVTASIGDQAGSPAAGSILIKTWQHDGTDPTPAAADTFSKLVNWIAIGY